MAKKIYVDIDWNKTKERKAAKAAIDAALAGAQYALGKEMVAAKDIPAGNVPVIKLSPYTGEYQMVKGEDNAFEYQKPGEVRRAGKQVY